MSADKQTVDFYDRTASTYSRDTTPKALPTEFLSFARLLPESCAVLDLGCGGGWAAAAFRDLGHRVTAMDASAKMVEQVARLGGIKTRHATFDDMDWIKSFDAIWASFSLQHQPRQDMAQTLENIARALKDGGLLYIGIHEGDEVIRDNLDRLYTPYTEQDLRARLALNHIEISRIERAQSTGYDGREIDCMHIEARKIG
ncbi:MAG: class I SAM-dependent methyltransferase [Alphaproteobacteria bacterium]|nr:class I SAM-dependent methyltransferase [Alphaproteobacteria bacterium]